MRCWRSTRQSTGHTRLTRDMVIGKLQANPALQLLILFQVGLEVEAELRMQNHLVSYLSAPAQEEKMREIRDMASGLKDAVAALRRDAAAAKGEFQSEFGRAQANTEKFKSFTSELKEANKEVESFLGETGSNFPTSEELVTPTVHADRNGVVANKG